MRGIGFCWGRFGFGYGVVGLDLCVEALEGCCDYSWCGCFDCFDG